jgi:hypothetical protein
VHRFTVSTWCHPPESVPLASKPLKRVDGLYIYLIII